MKKNDIVKIVNTYFKKQGNKNLVNKYSIDHPVEVSVYDIRRSRRTNKVFFFLDTEPTYIEHTIEDSDGEPIDLDIAVQEEFKTVMSILNMSDVPYRVYVNKRTLDDMLPYDESQISENVKIRTFKSNVDSGELVWHRDREDRIVEVIEGNGWMVQLDNDLPKKLTKENKVFIPKGVYHRIIKGEGDLKVKIEFVNV